MSAKNRKKQSNKEFSGICLTVIGIVLILVGVIRYYTAYGWLGDLMELIYTLVAAIPLSFIGVVLWIHSAVLKKRMKNLEKLKKIFNKIK